MSICIELRLAAIILAAACLAPCGCGRETKQVEKGPIPPGEYTVLEGDNLSWIAVRAYGDMKLWYSLLNANPELTKRPNFNLVPGETIKVPNKAAVDRSLPKSAFPKKLPADYIIMPGDSLPLIAAGCYGNRDLWMRIYEANRSVLSANVKEDPRQLIAGQVLRIPTKDSGGQGAGSREPK